MAFLKKAYTLPTLQYTPQVNSLLAWLIRLDPPKDAASFILDTTESVFSLVPEGAHKKIKASTSYYNDSDWRSSYGGSPVNFWTGRMPGLAHLLGDRWAGKDVARWWQLLHWRDQPIPGVPRMRPDLDSLVWAVTERVATQADLYDQLLGPSNDFGDLSRLTARPQTADPAPHPVLDEPVRRCRERIIEVELARGENPTAASEPARTLSAMYGTDLLFRLLAALGDRPFSTRSSTGRAEVFTDMIQACYPLPEDTPEAFAARAKAAKARRGPHPPARHRRAAVAAARRTRPGLGGPARGVLVGSMAHLNSHNGNALTCDDGADARPRPPAALAANSSASAPR